MTFSEPSNCNLTNSVIECAGCQKELKEGQALVALERQWHIWCFKCGVCDAVLHGEYMGRDGVPYCERDYQKQYGVKCAYCNRYISGKVLQVRMKWTICQYILNDKDTATYRSNWLYFVFFSKTSIASSKLLKFGKKM